MKSSTQTLIRQYVAAAPPETRRRLKQIRALVRRTAPGAVEVFSYRIPGFRLNDKPLVWYAAFKEHIGLYPMTAAIRRTHAKALKKYKMSTGTVRVPLDRPLDLGLVRRLVKARVAEVKK